MAGLLATGRGEQGMREKRCVDDGSVCQNANSYLDPEVQTVADMRAKGNEDCPVFSKCRTGAIERQKISCAPLMGIEVARFVLKQGNSVTDEIKTFKREIAKAGRKGFFDPYDDPEKVITDLDEGCQMVQKWAETILGLNPLDAGSYGQTYDIGPGEKSYPVLDESVWDPDGKIWVHECGATLAKAEVTHSIHDSGMPLAGSGRVHTETVPYCPNCGKKPSEFGAPLDHDPGDARDLEILRRMRT